MGIPARQMVKLQDTNLRTMAELLKSLADETRLTILTLLLKGEMCVCEIMGTLPISQPAVSHHLKILRQAGLVNDRRQGKWIYYRLDPEALALLMDHLHRTLIDPGITAVDKPRHHPLCDV